MAGVPTIIIFSKVINKMAGYYGKIAKFAARFTERGGGNLI